MAIVWWPKKQSTLEKIYMSFNKPGLPNKVNLFRLLAATQKAWLWIRESLQSIEKSETHPWLKKILKDTIEQINEWVWFSDALAKYSDFFPRSEIELIRSSEQMWKLPETLDNMAVELEKFQAIKSKLKSAMMYPSIVLLVAIAAVIILLIKVIPSIIQIFPANLELPAITQFVIGASDYLKENYKIIFWLFVLIPILYTFLYSKFLPFKIVVDKFILKIPVIWPLVKTFYRYRFSKLLWDFYNAWISPIDSLDQIYNIFSNYHYKKKILDVKKDLEVWLEMAASFEGSWLFNPILIQIIWVWEKTGNIWEILIKMADFYRDEVDTKVEWLTKMIEPLLMVFISTIIWWIVSSIFLPMADLIWSLSQ